MSFQDDLKKIADDITAVESDHSAKADAITTALQGLDSALAAVRTAVEDLVNTNTPPAPAPAAPGTPTAETAPADPAPADVPPTPADTSAPVTLNPMTGEPVVDNVDANGAPLDQPTS